MILFCDTEFTDFDSPDLISVGMVSEDGEHEFYAELKDFNTNTSSKFVKQHIYPLLNFKEHGVWRDSGAVKWIEWINQLPPGDITIMIDYIGDYTLIRAWTFEFANKLTRPLKWQYANHSVCDKVVQVESSDWTASVEAVQAKWMLAREQFFVDHDSRRHHALVDAKALRHAWLECSEMLKN